MVGVFDCCVGVVTMVVVELFEPDAVKNQKQSNICYVVNASVNDR